MLSLVLLLLLLLLLLGLGSLVSCTLTLTDAQRYHVDAIFNSLDRNLMPVLELFHLFLTTNFALSGEEISVLMIKLLERLERLHDSLVITAPVHELDDRDVAVLVDEFTVELRSLMEYTAYGQGLCSWTVVARGLPTSTISASLSEHAVVLRHHLSFFPKSMRQIFKVCGGMSALGLRFSHRTLLAILMTKLIRLPSLCVQLQGPIIEESVFYTTILRPVISACNDCFLVNIPDEWQRLKLGFAAFRVDVLALVPSPESQRKVKAALADIERLLDDGLQRTLSNSQNYHNYLAIKMTMYCSDSFSEAKCSSQPSSAASSTSTSTSSTQSSSGVTFTTFGGVLGHAPSPHSRQANRRPSDLYFDKQVPNGLPTDHAKSSIDASAETNAIPKSAASQDVSGFNYTHIDECGSIWQAFSWSLIMMGVCFGLMNFPFAKISCTSLFSNPYTQAKSILGFNNALEAFRDLLTGVVDLTRIVFKDHSLPFATLSMLLTTYQTSPTKANRANLHLAVLNLYSYIFSISMPTEITSNLPLLYALGKLRLHVDGLVMLCELLPAASSLSNLHESFEHQEIFNDSTLFSLGVEYLSSKLLLTIAKSAGTEEDCDSSESTRKDSMTRSKSLRTTLPSRVTFDSAAVSSSKTNTSSKGELALQRQVVALQIEIASYRSFMQALQIF